MCLPPRKIQLFLSEFRKYRFTSKEIVDVCAQSGGLLGISHRSLVGLFDTLRNNYNMDAKSVKACIISCPEFALQNRQDLIRRKAELIMKESGRHQIYMRNFIKRHPDIILRSFASLEAKINYFTRTLNRQLREERSFPLILHYNYN